MFCGYLNVDKVSFGKLKQKLFSFDELERILNLRPFVNTQRFRPCRDMTRYEWQNNAWASDNYCWPIDIIEKILKESSCYLKDCSKINKKINNVAKELEEIFKKSVDCHIYFSLNKTAQHFQKHKDKSHNLIVASEGAIKVEVENTKKILKSGDYVFIPAQVYHKIIPQTDKRISCSFPITLIESVLENRKWMTIT